MIVDTSAIVAILLREPAWATLKDKLMAAALAGVSAPILVEAGIVLSARMRKDARSLLARFLYEAEIEIVPFSELHYSVAIDAWLRFGWITSSQPPTIAASAQTITITIRSRAVISLLLWWC